LNRKPYVLLALFVALLFSALTATSANASSSASRSDAEQALAEAQAILGGGPVSASASVSAAGPHDATIVLHELSLGLDQLSPADRRAAERILARPSDPGDQDSFGNEAAASPICDANFCIHWGTNAKAAPRSGDANTNGIPDFVEQTLAAGAQTFAVENVSLGWPEGVSDGAKGARNGKGNAGQTDVYLTNLPRGLYGYTTTDPGNSGRKIPGYLVLDNDYKGFDGVPVNLMQVTMAHEYNHVLQFAIDNFQDSWMFESTATFMENNVFPNVNDYINFVPPFAGNPFSPLAEPDRQAFKLYGSAVWNHYLASQYGPGVVLHAWQVSTSVKPQDFAVAAYDRAITDAGGPGFASDFVSFAAATAEWNSSTDFPDPALLPGMKRSGSLKAKPRSFELAHTAYQLLNVKPPNGQVSLKIKTKKGVRSGLALVGRVGPTIGGTVESAVKYLPDGGTGKVTLPNVSGYSRVTAVIVNADGRVQGNSRFYTRDGIKYAAKLGG
jgi:hypothetical protein